MSEDRFIDIETKLAHQEQLVSELNEVVTEQQSRIMQLEQLSKSLIDRVRAIGESGGDDGPANDRPPHY
jgi:SlyX protein